MALPKIGSEWLARDGRRLRVEEVTVPTDPDAMPWCKMTVLNATGKMKKSVKMAVNNFSDDKYSRFLQRVGKPT